MLYDQPHQFVGVIINMWFYFYYRLQENGDGIGRSEPPVPFDGSVIFLLHFSESSVHLQETCWLHPPHDSSHHPRPH